MISIIIASYNDYAFLKRCLPSCLKQNVEVEIVLVDDYPDGKFDGEIMQFISDNNVVYIKNDKNVGLGGARNIGINNSKYSFYLPLDTDDFLFDEALLKIVNRLRPDCGIHYGNLFHSVTNSIFVPFTGELTREIFLKENPIFSCSLVRKSVWEKVGGYLEQTGAYYDDWNFWCRCFKNNIKFKYVPVDIFYHEVRKGSLCCKIENNKEYHIKLATQDLM